MTTMREFKTLLEGAPRVHGESPPDVASITRQGRRLRRRRRAGASTLAAACCLAIAVPVAAQVDGDGGTGKTAPGLTDDQSRGVEPTVEPTGRPPCGEWLCVDGGRPADPLGAVVDTGDRVASVPVLLYAERSRVVDMESGELVRRPAITVGYRDAETDRLLTKGRLVWPDAAPPEIALPMHVSSGGGPWVVTGGVTDPAAVEVTAVDSAGVPIEVRLSEAEVAPGMRVFWASGSMADRELMRVEFRVLDANGQVLVSCRVGRCGITG